jgi:hypothetical protein
MTKNISDITYKNEIIGTKDKRKLFVEIRNLVGTKSPVISH